MVVRISFEIPPARSGRPRPRQVLRYRVTELLEAAADWWYLRRAGRSPRVWIRRR